MEWQVILALVLVIPIILFPVVLIWYLNAGGVYTAIKEGRLKAFELAFRKIRIGLASGHLCFRHLVFSWSLWVASNAGRRIGGAHRALRTGASLGSSS